MKFIVNCMSVLLVSSVAFAAPDVSFDGTITQTIARTSTTKAMLKNNSPKKVVVLKVNISEQVKNAIHKNAAHKRSLRAIAGSKKLPAVVQLGMNNVPVLDQGAHGTCATFALFAALDAMRGEGDYYSPLCSLNLGKTLANNGYSLSGWDGQFPSGLLARVDEFGLVSKNDQRTQGCGGLTEYPVDDEDDSTPMSLEDFHAISAPAYYSGLSAWSSIFDITKWITKDIPAEQILEKTKTSLYYGNRVLIGMLLPIQADLGASGEYHIKNDTWVMTGPLEQEVKMFTLEHSSWGGHALVITGYDDNAVPIDHEGNAHKGLFTLRNSWGTDAGDNGNYYLSYDYVALLTIELDELIKISH